jgi:hypothetical protein
MSTRSTTRNTASAAVPIISMGAAWAARKGMVKGYEAKTGRPAPVAHSKHSSILTKVLWAAALAGIIALVEAIVWQAFGDDEQGEA